MEAKLFLHELAHCLGLGHPNESGSNFSQGQSYMGLGVMDPANCSDTTAGSFLNVLNTAEFNTLKNWK